MSATAVADRTDSATRIEKRAHAVWEVMQREAANHGLALVKNKHFGDGRVLVATIGAFIKALNTERNWGLTDADVDAVRRYLKTTGNVVTLAKVEQYQRTEEGGRGSISRYLDPFKSPYRFELQEPKTDDDAVRRTYYTAARDALMMVLPVYLKCTAQVQMDQGFAQDHEQKMNFLAKELYTKDFAVKSGRNIFKEHFAKYWAEGFWNVEMPAETK